MTQSSRRSTAAIRNSPPLRWASASPTILCAQPAPGHACSRSSDSAKWAAPCCPQSLNLVDDHVGGGKHLAVHCEPTECTAIQWSRRCAGALRLSRRLRLRRSPCATTMPLGRFNTPVLANASRGASRLRWMSSQSLERRHVNDAGLVRQRSASPSLTSWSIAARKAARSCRAGRRRHETCRRCSAGHAFLPGRRIEVARTSGDGGVKRI